MKKSFDSCSTQADEAQFESLLSEAERKMERAGADSVEQIQDIVEETLMEQGYFREAKAYILYRQERSQLRSIRQELASSLEIEGFEKLLRDIAQEFSGEAYALSILNGKFTGFLKRDMDQDEKLGALIKAGNRAYESGSSAMGKYCGLAACLPVSQKTARGRRKARSLQPVG